MKEQIQKRLSDSKAARWTALFIVSFTMMCGYFLTDVMAPLENLLTTKGKVVYFTDNTSMPADSLVAKVELFAEANALSAPDLTVQKLEEGAKYQYIENINRKSGKPSARPSARYRQVKDGAARNTVSSQGPTDTSMCSC